MVWRTGKEVRGGLLTHRDTMQDGGASAYAMRVDLHTAAEALWRTQMG